MKDQDSDQVGQFTRISQLLRKAEHEPDEAVELAERISNMASTNVIAEIRSYTKSQDSKFDFLKESMNSKYNTLIWIMGILVAAGIFNALSDFFNWGA